MHRPFALLLVVLCLVATWFAPATGATVCCASVLDCCRGTCADGDCGWEAAGTADGTAPDAPCCPDGCHDCARPCCGGMQAGDLQDASPAADVPAVRCAAGHEPFRPSARNSDIFHPPRI